MAAERQWVRPPVWPSRAERPRVLIEAASERVRDHLARLLTGASYEVLGCGGPETAHGETCPAVDGGRCPGAAHADVVICDIDAEDGRFQGVPVAVARELRAGASVIVLSTEPALSSDEIELDAVDVLVRPVADDELLTAVAEAVAALQREPRPRPLSARRRLWSN